MVKLTKEILEYVRSEALKNAVQSSRKDDLGLGILTESEWLTTCWIKAVQSAQGSVMESSQTALSPKFPEFDTSKRPTDVSSVNDDG